MKVTPAVLIPRPETELLVDLALERTPQDRAFAVLDLATGSGCVAVAIAGTRPAVAGHGDRHLGRSARRRA